MPWLFQLPEYVYKPLMATIGAIAVALIGVVWPRHRRASGEKRTVAERLGNIEGRLEGVENNIETMRGEHREDMREIRDWMRHSP